MRLFVSYSRHDASTVRRLVAALEAEGHDVWIDTDDIRGSERWRSSVATAIRASDVVLLVVSPAAMASSSVEREISVAAENSLRIVPVVIEDGAHLGRTAVRPRRRPTRSRSSIDRSTRAWPISRRH